MAQFVWGDTSDPLPVLDFVTQDDSWTKREPPSRSPGPD